MQPDGAPFQPRSRPRREDLRLLTGSGRYVTDLAGDALRPAFVRSIEAHAEVTAIDPTTARSMPGVVDVLTADDLRLPDIPGDSLALAAPDFPRPHLASRRVRYVGEPIAVVLAETAEAALEASESVEVSYSPLPVVADPERAVEDTTLVHPAAGTNVVERFESGPPFRPLPDEIVATVTVENGRVAPMAVEPLGIVAEPDGDGGVVVWCGHQFPHGLRKTLADLLALPPAKVRVVVPDVGGAFGLKGKMFPEYTVVAALALRTGRRVAWLERRRESFSGGTHGRGSRTSVTLAASPDGRIRAARFDILAEVGAYPHNGGSIPVFSRYLAPGLYDIPEVTIASTTVVTNRAPTGSYRGAGRPEAAYAIERAMDELAAAAGLDPLQVRLANVIPAERLPFRTVTGALYDSGDYAKALRAAAEAVGLEDLRREQARRRETGGTPLGVGFGAFVERAGGGLTTGEFGRVEVGAGGRVTLFTGSTSAGQGHETVWPGLVADRLGLDEEEIVFVAGDTALVARGTGSAGSRSAQLGGSALWNASAEVRRRAVELAAELLEAAPEDIVVEGGRFSVAGVPGLGPSWADVVALASERGVELAAEEWFAPGAQTFPYGVHVAVVEVDRDTGEVRLLEMVTVDDCGRVLDPMIVHGQVQGSLVQGIGQALHELVRYSEDGQLLTSTLMDYPLPRATDVPPMRHARLVSPAPSNPLGVKGTGEAGCIGAPPAIVNAVLDALRPEGVTHLDMPLRPSAVWEALRRASSPSR